MLFHTLQSMFFLWEYEYEDEDEIVIVSGTNIKYMGRLHATNTDKPTLTHPKTQD